MKCQKRSGVSRQPSAITVVNDDTKALIASSVSENTERNYRYWSKAIETWLGGRSLDDGLLAEYITGLHAQGKSPSDNLTGGRGGAVAGTKQRR